MAEQRKRWELTDRDIYNSVLYSTLDARAVVRHQLDSRAQLPLNCPGNGGPSLLFGLGLPDRWGRFFHPNEKGHETIASFALEAVIRRCEPHLCDLKGRFSSAGKRMAGGPRYILGYWIQTIKISAIVSCHQLTLMVGNGKQNIIKAHQTNMKQSCTLCQGGMCGGIQKNHPWL